MFNSSGPDAYAVDAARSESRLVWLTIKTLGLQHLTREIQVVHAEWTGEPGRLTFAALRAVLPEFPLAVAFEPLYKLHLHTACSGREMMTRPQRSLIESSFAEYSESMAMHGQGKPLGLVFRYAGVRGGLIVHDSDFGDVDERWGSRLTWTCDGQRRTVQRYAAVLAAIRDSPWEAAETATAIRAERAQVLDVSELMRLIPDPNQLRIVLLIVSVTCGASAGLSSSLAATPHLVRHEGRRWLRCSHADLAEAAGISIHAAKRACRALRQSQIVEVRRRGRASIYGIATAVRHHFLKEIVK